MSKKSNAYGCGCLTAGLVLLAWVGLWGRHESPEANTPVSSMPKQVYSAQATRDQRSPAPDQALPSATPRLDGADYVPSEVTVTRAVPVPGSSPTLTVPAGTRVRVVRIQGNSILVERSGQRLAVAVESTDLIDRMLDHFAELNGR